MTLRPSGFPEYNPGQQIVFDQLIEIIQKNYKQFGYTHIQTPAVELNKVLLSKNGEDAGKQIFGLYGLAQGAEDLKEYALHFDLTVPFARYVLDWENELTFPFKRFQIQPAWRGERAQRGRFRELRQCDIDVIWKEDDKKSDYLFYDAEVIVGLDRTINDIFSFGQIDDVPVFHINNKKIINGLLLALLKTDELKSRVSSLIDKYMKIGEENFVLSLKDLNIKEKEINKLLEFMHMNIENDSELMQLQGFVKSEEFDQGVEELVKVVSLLNAFKKNFPDLQYKVDFKIVRGLDYYTGTVFECHLEKDPGLGSVCGGGRYDNLTGYIDPKKKYYSGVGGSIGISRILGKILENEKFDSSQQTIAKYLFVNFEETFNDIVDLASNFIKDGDNVEIYPLGDKLGKQFTYADKKGIPYVVIFGQGEKDAGNYKIKNMKTGEEEVKNIG